MPADRRDHQLGLRRGVLTAGEDLRVVGAEDDEYAWHLTRGLEPFASLHVPPDCHARLELDGREYTFEPYGRGWRLAIADPDGEPHAWYDAKGWRIGGRLVIAPEHELRLVQPFAWRDARLSDDEGGLLARFDLYERHDRRCVMSDGMSPVPAGLDGGLVWALAASLVLMRATLMAPPGPRTHTGEGGWFDGGIFGGGDGGGGGGGGGDGGGGGGGS